MDGNGSSLSLVPSKASHVSSNATLVGTLGDPGPSAASAVLLLYAVLVGACFSIRNVLSLILCFQLASQCAFK